MQHCHGSFPIWFLEVNCAPHLKGTAPKVVASSTLHLLVLVTVLCSHSYRPDGNIPSALLTSTAPGYYL